MPLQLRILLDSFTNCPRKDYCEAISNQVIFTGDKGGQGNHWGPGGFGQVLRVHRRNHQENRAKLICEMIKHFFVTKHCSAIFILLSKENSNSQIERR